MAKEVDSALGGNDATGLYRRLYAPTSNLFVHANAGSLLRHVTKDDRLTRRPSRAWTRRAPARCSDAALGILAFQIANRRGSRAGLFAQYASAHLSLVPPPVTVIAGINYGRSLTIRQIVGTIQAIRHLRTYTWSAQAAADTPDDRKARIREGLGTILNTSEFGIPADAAEAWIEFLANVIADGNVQDS
jgi:hypothetical protein